MVRYLDGRIVSTKGERFTEIKKEDAEEMKKTYINLKPAKKYRFHWCAGYTITWQNIHFYISYDVQYTLMISEKSSL